jgi:hypothetical protein
VFLNLTRVSTRLDYSLQGRLSSPISILKLRFQANSLIQALCWRSVLKKPLETGRAFIIVSSETSKTEPARWRFASITHPAGTHGAGKIRICRG